MRRFNHLNQKNLYLFDVLNAFFS